MWFIDESGARAKTCWDALDAWHRTQPFGCDFGECFWPWTEIGAAVLWRNDVDGAGLHRGVCHVVSRIGNGGGRTGAGGRDV